MIPLSFDKLRNGQRFHFFDYECLYTYPEEWIKCSRDKYRNDTNDVYDVIIPTLPVLKCNHTYCEGGIIPF